MAILGEGSFETWPASSNSYITTSPVSITLEVPNTGYIRKVPPGQFGIRVGEPPDPFPSVTTLDFSQGIVTMTIVPVTHWHNTSG